MTTGREQVLSAVFAALEGVSGPRVLREAAVPERVPPAGLVIMRDGEPGEPETVIGPQSNWYDHAVGVECYWSGDDLAGGLDTLTEQVATALESDRTLGGKTIWIELEAGEPETIPVEGGRPVKATTMTAIVSYITVGAFGQLEAA